MLAAVCFHMYIPSTKYYQGLTIYLPCGVFFLAVIISVIEEAVLFWTTSLYLVLLPI